MLNLGDTGRTTIRGHHEKNDKLVKTRTSLIACCPMNPPSTLVIETTTRRKTTATNVCVLEFPFLIILHKDFIDAALWALSLRSASWEFWESQPDPKEVLAFMDRHNDANTRTWKCQPWMNNTFTCWEVSAKSCFFPKAQGGLQVLPLLQGQVKTVHNLFETKSPHSF